MNGLPHGKPGGGAVPFVNDQIYSHMKKLVIVLALLAGCMQLQAKNSGYDHPWTVSAGAGPMFNLYENFFSILDNKQSPFTYQTALSFGYDFNRVIGVRLQAGYGKDIAACNVLQTSGGGFYPYNFQHVNLFADVLLDVLGHWHPDYAFRFKLLAGGGFAQTFSFTDSGHPWQKVQNSNTAFGFRLGAIGQYNFTGRLGAFVEITAEAFTDNYNGLEPTEQDKQNFKGYPGFPLDLRAPVVFGIQYRF